MSGWREEQIGPHRVILGDCLEVLPTIEGAHSCVTDPPYEIGFMNRKWDNTGIAFRPETWELVLNALRPGGHLAAFSGCRTYHRMASAIEDSGFECREMVAWLFGSGFPKSLNISKALDKMAGAKGSLGVKKANVHSRGDHVLHEGWRRPWMDDPEAVDASGREYIPATEVAKKWSGFGTALKPAHEPICLARRPLSEKTVAANVLEHECGGLNIDACRVGETVETWPSSRSYAPGQMQPGGKGVTQSTGDAPEGRWPANVLHDNSLEVIECFAPEDRPAARFFYSPKASAAEREEGLEGVERRVAGSINIIGSETVYLNRNGKAPKRANHHPTVKPIDLMAWLIRLVTPTRGIALDPFMGSGSTGIAAHRQGFRFIGIERSPEYFEIAVRRLRAAYEKPDLFIEQPKSEKPHQEALCLAP